MNTVPRIVLFGLGLAGTVLWATTLPRSTTLAPVVRPVTEPVYRSPNQICLSPDGVRACVINQSANSVSVLDLRTRQVVVEVPVGPSPAHAVFSPDGTSLYVSCLHGGVIDVVDLGRGRVARAIQTGDEPYGLALSRDGRTLYAANSLSDSVSVLAVDSGRTLSEIPVGHDPRFVAPTPDGLRLLVGNGLSRSVSIIDLAAGRVVETRDLGRSSILRQLKCSLDGRWAFVACLVSHDEVPPLQIERGWIHSNGFTVLDLTRPGHRVTLLLDRLLAGAANPWGVALAADQQRLYVSLAGVHEIALIDLPAALQLVGETTPDQVKAMEENVEILEQRRIARRVPAGGLGPRGLALDEPRGELLVANYFSDTVSILDAATGELRATIPLGPPQALTERRQGELLFNDARITFQGWFTCASCHQEDATVDGLNWDLTNDGVGNPKNVKSMFDVRDTPPAMWSGVRDDMHAGVAAGERFQGFLPDSENHRALMAYLRTLERPPNPFRYRNMESARRGESIFRRVGCDLCHPPPLFTDLQHHDVGLGTLDDYRSRFDTPSLRDCYRTAPYLHDGRAKTLRDVFVQDNPDDLHGRTKGLTRQEIEDLVNYLKTL